MRTKRRAENISISGFVSHDLIEIGEKDEADDNKQMTMLMLTVPLNG